MVSLQRLVDEIPNAEIVGDSTVGITSVVDDSRQAEGGSLFVARPGTQCDGALFIADAVARGARAVVSTRPVPVPAGVTLVLVKDPVDALSRLAASWHGYPASQMSLIGVTGTDGKTSVTFLIAGMLTACGTCCLYVGTLGAHCLTLRTSTRHTTPPPLELQRILRWGLEHGARAGALEASSHSLDQGRLQGLVFHAAVFTTFGRDHLDYHSDEKAYLNAKLRLFEQVTPSGVAIINGDHPHIVDTVRQRGVRVVTFSASGRTADVMVIGSRMDLGGTEVALRWAEHTMRIRSKLLGLFQVENLAAAAAVGLALGVPPYEVAHGLEAVHHIPGRFEPVLREGTAWAIVDYAHTPGALERALTSARAIARGRVIAVFGCGGNRDRGKRPLMGSVASRLSDLVIVTSDNPRHEDPHVIIDEILQGIDGPAEVRIRADRREALALAAAETMPGDIVLVAGKGHERTQTVASEVLAFSDIDELSALHPGAGTNRPTEANRVE